MTKQLTGAYRYRTGLFGRQILQVEETEEIHENVFNTGHFDVFTRTTWRDARKKDSQVLTILGKFPSSEIVPQNKTNIIPSFNL
jgi:hypothetical protein